MIKENLTKILSLNGFSVLFGIIGGILGILTIFINWNDKVSIKWLALVIIICTFLVLISFKLTFEIFESNQNKIYKSNKVIQYSQNDSLLLVQNNRNLEFSQSVSIFFNINNFQILLANAYVQNIQEEFIQIKIISFDENFTQTYSDEYNRILNNENNALTSIIIKNYISYNG